MSQPTSTSTSTPQQPQLQLAHLLSDLVSLRVCDPTAALALVSARSSSSSSSYTASKDVSKDEAGKVEGDAAADPDVQRAKDLVELHYAVKEAHKKGELSGGLAEARASVERAISGW